MKSRNGKKNLPRTEIRPAQPDFIILPDPAGEELISRLKRLDPDNLTPIEALTILQEMKGIVKDEE